MIIPIPTHHETEVVRENDESDYDRIRRYINCPNWKCDACGAVMMGRCESCVYCKMRLNTHTPRPETWRES